MSITEMENTQEFKDALKVLFYQKKKSKRNTAISAKSLISLYANDTAGDSSSALDNFVRN